MTERQASFTCGSKFPLAMFLFLLIFTALKAEAQTLQQSLPKVFVSIAPQKYFLERIASGYIEIGVLIPTGSSPATYAPKPSQIKKIHQAQLFFSIGVPAEKKILSTLQVLHPNLKIVAMQDVHHEGDDHSGHQHYHDGVAHENPHTWLSPSWVRKKIPSIEKHLIDLLGKKTEADISKRCRDFEKELEALDQNIRAILKKGKVRHILVYHPSWSHFAEDFGIEEIAIEENGKEPSIKSLIALTKRAKKMKIDRVFTQKAFPLDSAKKLGHLIGAQVIQLDPMSEDYQNNLIYVAKVMAKELP